MSGRLHIVPTPVGNLEDMTFRAIRTLKEADLVLAEDTRTSAVLMKHYDIHTPMRSHHRNNEHKAVDGIVEEILGGKDVALVSDAHARHLRPRIYAGTRMPRRRYRGGMSARSHGLRTGTRCLRTSLRAVRFRGIPAPQEGARHTSRPIG